MNENQLQNLLRECDRAAGKPLPVRIDTHMLRNSIRKRRQVQRVGATCLVFTTLVIVFFLWAGKRDGGNDDPVRVAQLEADVAALKADTTALLAKVEELTRRQEHDQAIDRVQARLQAIPDPATYVRHKTDEAAFYLMQQAELLWQEPGKRKIAIPLYKQIIKLYPDSPSARAARIRLDRRRRRPLQETEKGAEQWQDRKRYLS